MCMETCQSRESAGDSWVRREHKALNPGAWPAVRLGLPLWVWREQICNTYKSRALLVPQSVQSEKPDAAVLRLCFQKQRGLVLRSGCLQLPLVKVTLPWQVFFSAYIFNSNVMVKVATQPADNPLDVLSRKLHLGPNVGRDVPRLSLPGKLVFPR